MPTGPSSSNRRPSPPSRFHCLRARVVVFLGLGLGSLRVPADPSSAACCLFFSFVLVSLSVGLSTGDRSPSHKDDRLLALLPEELSIRRRHKWRPFVWSQSWRLRRSCDLLSSDHVTSGGSFAARHRGSLLTSLVATINRSDQTNKSLLIASAPFFSVPLARSFTIILWVPSSFVQSFSNDDFAWRQRQLVSRSQRDPGGRLVSHVLGIGPRGGRRPINAAWDRSVPRNSRR